jgi:hypothetical protein
VHKVVLQNGGTYFNNLFTTGQAIAAIDKVERDRKCIKVDESIQVIEMGCDTEEDANANEAVLEFLYNHKLPACPSVSILSKVRISMTQIYANVTIINTLALAFSCLRSGTC